ncbi:tetratricopeptide repeat protein [Streptomyces sp. NPDC055189]
MAEVGAAVLCQILAGAGGVGKTQLAAHHARQAWRAGQVDLLLWITAATREAIVAAYATAGAAVLGADPDRPEQAAEEFLAWLEPNPASTASESPGCRWMVVLDDLTDPADLRGLWPPSSSLGETLVTTRRRDSVLTSGSRRRVDVGLFTEAEADTYLTAALANHGRADPPAHIHALTRDLGRLPLALAQAAAYLNNARFNEADTQAEFLPIDCLLSCPAPCARADCVNYRKQLSDRARTLDDVLPEPGALPDDQAATVSAAWSLSIDRANTLRPAGLARPMLQLTAMLDPNGIPTAVLTSPPALTHLTEERTTPHTRRQNPVSVSAEDAVGALRALHRLCLLDTTADPGSTTAHQTVRVHNLIQRAVRDPLPTDRYDQLARTAADALTAVWPEVPRETTLEQHLRANTTVLTACANEALYRPDAHEVLYLVGRSIGEAGHTITARDHFAHLTTTTSLRLGPDHPDTLTSRHHLARWQGQAGDPAGAATAFAELLGDRVRVLGPDHPDTLITRHNRDRWRGEAGDPSGAAADFSASLRDRIRVLGPDHPDTLIARHNLAHWRGEAGNTAEAVASFDELLHDLYRVLGPDDPHTLSARHNLAYWRGKAGDPAGAATAFAELLEDRTRVLGPDHPHAFTTRHNLAYWRGKAGDPAGAATAFAELLEDRTRVIGPDHPDTLTTRNNLVYWQDAAGRGGA